MISEKNLANQLTLFRIFLIPLLMFLILSERNSLALGIFVFAALTDIVDGYIARHGGSISTFGKFADPVADKLLVTSMLITFVQLGELTATPVVIILAREFMVTGLRLLAISKEVVISASWWGKAKTICQLILIGVLMFHKGFHIVMYSELRLCLTVVTVIITVISGVYYFVANRSLLQGIFTAN